MALHIGCLVDGSVSRSGEVGATLMSMCRGRNLSRVVAGLRRRKMRFLSAKKAHRFVRSLKCPYGTIRSLAACPSVLNNEIGALRPGVFKNVLYHHNLRRSVRRVRGCRVPRVSLMVISLCPFRTAITSNTSRTSVVRGVSVNKVSLVHTTTGGCGSMVVMTSRTRCGPLLSVLVRRKTASSLRRHH